MPYAQAIYGPPDCHIHILTHVWPEPLHSLDLGMFSFAMSYTAYIFLSSSVTDREISTTDNNVCRL